MTRVFAVPFLLLFLILVISVPAFGHDESRSIVSDVQVNGDLSSFTSAYSSSAAVQSGVRHLGLKASTVPPFNVRLSDGSEHVVVFDRLQEKTWGQVFEGGFGIVEDPSAAVFFRGEATDTQSGAKVPAAGAVFVENGVLSLIVHLVRASDALSITIPLEESTQSFVGRAEAANLSELANMKCGMKHPPVAPTMKAASSEAPARSAATYQIVEVATDADGEWYAYYGASANNRIATIINAANTIYQRDLGIEIAIASQHVWTEVGGDPYSSLDSGVLLDSFGDYTNSNQHLGSADLYHLFTGKDLDEGVVGIAWMGVVCSSPTYSYGLTQRYTDSMDHLITAHEIGHNFNAAHDTESPRSLMYPSIGSSQNFFSTTSIHEINTYKLEYGDSCLSGTYSPDPRTDEPSITLSLTYNTSRGSFEGGITRANLTGECAFAVEFSRTKNFSTRSAHRVGTGDYGLVTFSGRGARRTKAKSSESNAVYARARAICDGTTFVSRTKGFRVSKSTSSSYPTLRNWVSAAARSVQVTGVD